MLPIALLTLLLLITACTSYQRQPSAFGQADSSGTLFTIHHPEFHRYKRTLHFQIEANETAIVKIYSSHPQHAHTLLLKGIVKNGEPYRESMVLPTEKKYIWLYIRSLRGKEYIERIPAAMENIHKAFDLKLENIEEIQLSRRPWVHTREAHPDADQYLMELSQFP